MWTYAKINGEQLATDENQFVVESVDRPLIVFNPNIGEVNSYKAYLQGQKLANYDIKINIRIFDSDREKEDELRTRLYELGLTKDDPLALETYLIPDRYDLVVPNGDIKWEKKHGISLVTVTFTKLDAYQYAAKEEVNDNGDIYLDSSGGGVITKLSANFSSGEQPQFTLQETGEHLTFKQTSEACTISINNETREITNSVKENSWNELNLSSEFFDLNHGQNTIVTNGTVLFVKYRKRFI